MSSSQSQESSDSNKLEEEDDLELVGARTLKSIEKQHIFDDKEKSVNTPISQYLHWNFKPDQISELKARLSEEKPFETALGYFSHSEKFQQIKFNVKSLDELTRGGIDVGSITEIFGEAGSGKSQLCMQLAINVQLPTELGGLDGKVVYVLTEKKLPTARLAAMAANVKEKKVETASVNFLENIIVENCKTAKGLAEFVQERLPYLLAKVPSIKLIVLDSIAGIFRTETDYISRAKLMLFVVHELERHVEIHNFAIVTTNHLTTVPSDDDFGESTETAALGATWDSLVVTKLKVENVGHIDSSRVRAMEVVYSPRFPCQRAKFIVTENGVEDVQ